MRSRFSLALLALAGFFGNTGFQTAPSTETGPSKPYLFSTNVELVVLNATVRDKKGWLVPDLTQSDFELYEDGIAQTIRLFQHEDIPVSVGLVVDHSGSMRPKLADVIAAARTFVASSRSDDDMFVVNFNEQVTLELSAATRSANRSDQLALAIASRPTQGRTALYDAVIEASTQLQTVGPKKKVLIVIGDGGDNASSHSLAEALTVVERSNALAYTIGVFDNQDPDSNPGVLRRLAHVSGGEAFFPTQPSEVVSICEHIASDIRNQYTIGYVSSNPAQPGIYRSIRLAARATGKGKLLVRTRAGYISGEVAK